MARLEPQSARDYDGRTARAVKSVLVEIGQLLGSFKGKFALVGGAVPWLLLDTAEMPHLGTVDVDLALDPKALANGEYVSLVEALQKRGYAHRAGLRRFQRVRTVPMPDGGAGIDIIVDFLMPRHAEVAVNKPPLIGEFAAQRADGADLALRFCQMVTLDGFMPNGTRNQVSLAVASIPALLAMKGYALSNRMKPKDAYDIHYSIRHDPGGLDPLVSATLPLLKIDTARTGYECIAAKFRSPDDFGPTSVRQFMANSVARNDWTADQWQMDAFGQVNAWLAKLGLT